MDLIGKSLGRFWKRQVGLVSLEQVLAAADRAVVSSTAFFTTVLIARYSDASQLGFYAVGFSLLVSLAAFQESLTIQPYIIQWPSRQQMTTERVGALLTLSLLFSTGNILVLSIGALVVLGLFGNTEIAVMIFAVAGALPFVLTREFVRRSGFVCLKKGGALLQDVAVATIQLAALGWVGSSGRMSAVSACVALGGANAITAVGYLYYARSMFTLRAQGRRTIFKQSWALGKWLLLGRIATQLQKDITYWVAIFIANAAVAGVYAACMSIASLAKPLILLLGNALTAKLALAWKNDGGQGLWREAVRNTALIASLFLPLVLAVLFMSESVMRFLYAGTEYEGYGYTLTVLTLVMSCEALTLPASIALVTMKRARVIVSTGMVGAVLTVILVWLLMNKWGLLGAAWGSFFGAAASGIARWIVLRLRVAKVCDPAFVMRVLKDVTRSPNSRSWKMTRLGSGQHAETFLVHSNGLPILRGHNSVVAKLYKSQNTVTLSMVQDQFDALSSLHAALHGCEVNGWKISVPRPLRIHKSPLTLLMTKVPGRHIDSYKSKDDVLTSRNLRDAAYAFAAAMQRCWSVGRRHGDLGVHNALFDIEARKIAFIDPGTRESCPVCNDYTRAQAPAVLDLAHTLYDVTIDVTDLTGRPTMRTHREIFVENVLHAILENMNSPGEKRRFLEEIWRCAQQHLEECWNPSWSPRGLWHCFVKNIMIQRISSLLERVDSQIDIYRQAE